MMHIFEFYEETFPEHSLNNQGLTSQSNSNSSELSNQERKTNDSRVGMGPLQNLVNNYMIESEITTPTDVETPAKSAGMRQKKSQNSMKINEQITGEKLIADKCQIKKAAGSLVSGLYYQQVKQLQKCSTKSDLVNNPSKQY